MSIHSFVKAVASLQFENAFNPYSDRCEVHDRQGAPQWRAHTLSAVIDKAAKMAVDAVWIGRDLGYRGGRRTGLELPDDLHVDQQAQRWRVRPERQTFGHSVSERTSPVIRGMYDK